MNNCNSDASPALAANRERGYQRGWATAGGLDRDWDGKYRGTLLQNTKGFPNNNTRILGD